MRLSLSLVSSAILATALASTSSTSAKPVVLGRDLVERATSSSASASSAASTATPASSSSSGSSSASASGSGSSSSSGAAAGDDTSATASVVSAATTEPLISASAAPSASAVAALPPYGADNLSSQANTSIAGPYGLDNANCTQYTFEIPVDALNVNFTGVDNTYSNQSYVTGTILRYVNFQTDWEAEHISGTVPNNQTYNVSGTYCTPKTGAKANSSLITAIHGIGFNQDYWNFNYSSEYSLINQATSDGYSIFTYDRLGTGNSSAPDDGFAEVQSATEVSLYANLLLKLRNGTLIDGVAAHDKIVGVGHSYGSIQVQALSNYAPTLLDGIVLTGYSNSSAYTSQFLLASTLEAGSTVDNSTLSTRAPVWLASGSSAALISQFFWPPNYAPGAFRTAREGVDTVSLGQLFTLAAVAGTASNFTGPVFVTSGQRDLPFCGGDCEAGGIVTGVQALYPATKNFTSYIVPDTGHGIVPHYTGPESQRMTVQFFADNGL